MDSSDGIVSSCRKGEGAAHLLAWEAKIVNDNYNLTISAVNMLNVTKKQRA